MNELKWFVIETETNWSRQYYTDWDSMEDARNAAERIWEYAYSRKDRKHRRIEVAELWAFRNEYMEKWLPMTEIDEGFDRESMEGYWIGAYNPVLTIGPDDR